MEYYCRIPSPLGALLLASDGEALTGLWFTDQKNAPHPEDQSLVEPDALPAFSRTNEWLTLYWKGEVPNFLPPLKFHGTAFQQSVWNLLGSIPYGETTTYGEIARTLKNASNGKTASARAVGGAVGRNPISIIVPCHRVLGANGRMTGYAGGIERKEALLKLEKH